MAGSQKRSSTRDVISQAFRKERQKQLRDSFKEDVLIDKPGTRTNIIPGDLNLNKKSNQRKTTRPRNWERWREMGESKERKPSGPAIDIESAYSLMQESKRKKR